MMMKTKLNLIYLTLILIVLVNAQTYPTIKPFINDFANILSTEERNNLDIYCGIIERDTKYQITIVTVNSTQGDDPLNYANRIGEQNGVGQKETDNGVVILWVTDTKEGAIAVGRGAETYLNDAKVGEIGRSSREYFNEKRYYEGFQNIISKIEKTIKERDQTINQTITPTTTPKKNNRLLTILIVIMIFGLLIYLILSKSGILPRPNWHFRSGGNSFSGKSWGRGSFGGGGGRF
jgi:uncharacterized protein